LLQRAWSETLAGGTRIRPWPWADTWPVARLTAPEHGIDLIVLAGATGRTMAFGPGHLAGSAAIGDPGVAVLAAHRDTHFRFLERLAVGDRFTLQTPDGRRHVYRVQATEIADYRDAWIRQSRV